MQRGSPAPLDHHLRPLIDIFVAAHVDAALDVGRVGRGDVGLGHQEGRADLAVHQRLQPFVLLLARAVAVDDLHIAGVGRGAVEHLGRPHDPAHFLGAERILEVGEARPFELEAVVDRRRAVRGRHEQVPQALAARLVLQLLDDRQDLPALALALLFVIIAGPRADFCSMKSRTRSRHRVSAGARLKSISAAYQQQCQLAIRRPWTSSRARSRSSPARHRASARQRSSCSAAKARP